MTTYGNISNSRSRWVGFRGVKIGILAFLYSVLVFTVWAGTLDAIKPPVAPQKEHVISLHGQDWRDSYHWLRERENPEVLRYLESENAYLESIMAPEKELRERLFHEMKGRMKETDESVPVSWGAYQYYTREEQGKEYDLFCRRRSEMGAPEEILIDGNKMARGREFFSIGDTRISPNQELLAFSVDESGSEAFTVLVRDLKTRKFLRDRIPDTYSGLQWGNDNQTLFYVTFDEAHRPYQVKRHRIGTPRASDVVVFEEHDSTFVVWVEKSRDGRWIFILTSSPSSSEVWAIDAEFPDSEKRLVLGRRPGVEVTQAEHHDGRFLVVTNDQALNFRILAASAESFQADHFSGRGPLVWKEIAPRRPEIKTEAMEVFAGHLAIFERQNGMQGITLMNWKTEKQHQVKFPEPVYRYWVEEGENPEPTSACLRLHYDSMVTPTTTYDLDLESGELRRLKQEEVRGGYDPCQYVSERLLAVSHDGVKIPMSVVYRKNVIRDGQAPLYLTAYGAYGSSFDPEFLSYRLSLLDRGFVFAIAHIRGGGEMGRSWYDDGKLLKKKNSFLDLIACAEHLIREKYTSPDRLALSGCSAGGLLVAATTVMRPDLFQAVVADVPFVDVINTMLDPSIPLVTEEYGEWGNPAEKSIFEYMSSYSPYDNLKPQRYPHLLIIGGLNDSRVQYWEPAKFAARLRATKTGDELVLLRTNMDAGHGGASGRYDYLKDTALEYAFLLKTLGLQTCKP